MTWKIATLNPTVDRELEALPDDMKARFFWISELIRSHGLEKVGEPYVKHLQGILWEMRLKGRDGISRALYVVAKPKRVVVVRVFIKKTQKAPRKEIELGIEAGKGDRTMTDVRELHAKWMKNPSYRAEYEAMRPEFELAAAIIDTRSKAGLTQEELAKLMDAPQSLIARLESGTQNTTLKTLERFARATGTHLRIVFEPLPEACP